MVTAFIIAAVAIELLGVGVILAEDKRGSGVAAFFGVAVAIWGIATLMVHLGAL